MTHHRDTVRKCRHGKLMSPQCKCIAHKNIIIVACPPECGNEEIVAYPPEALAEKANQECTYCHNLMENHSWLAVDKDGQVVDCSVRPA